MEQDKEQHREQGEVEDIGRERNHKDPEETEKGRYGLHTSGTGRMLDLVSFNSKLAKIGDILSHLVGPDVKREMIEKESFE